MPDAVVLIEAAADLSFVMQGTTYFEIDSDHVGDRFGVWVTPPLAYHHDDTSYPSCSRPTATSWHR